MFVIDEHRTPPKFCQYVDDSCDQDLSVLRTQDTFFIYPGQPQQIDAAIEGAVQNLQTMGNATVSWKQLPVSGQIIFCEICKAMRGFRTIVADVSTLNFNLMFEIGFAIGLDLPLMPIRDTSYVRDKRAFEELGVLDTVGYVDFANSQQLAHCLVSKLPGAPIAQFPTHQFHEPLYVVKGRVETEGAL